MTQVLRHELHAHLAGCLTAQDLWTWGRDRYRKYPERLTWYADEYEKVCGRRPVPTAYWEKDDGFDRLKHDFVFKTPAPFPVFQAHINLMIALFPVGEDNGEVLRRVLIKGAEEGLAYAEYRVFVSPTMADFDAYFSQHANLCLAIQAESGGSFQPRLALTLSRLGPEFEKQYRALRSWQSGHPDLAKAIVAIDFCGNEEIDPPKNKRSTFARIRQDNAESPDRALAILHHVGESFENHSLASAARWVWQAQDFGAHRLGHALAAAVHPDICKDRPFLESANERIDHLQWLLVEEERLHHYGYDFDSHKIRNELESLHSTNSFNGAYDRATLDDTHRLQDAVLEFLADQKAVVEVCPTSNFRIGRIAEVAHHSLPRFREAGVDIVIASDDPGVFDITLNDEAELCRTIFGLSQAELRAIDANAEAAKSSFLARSET